MTNPTKKSRASRQLARRASEASVPASMEFLIFEDNGGSYHWRIHTDDGAILAHSEGFASYDTAEQAAQRIRDGAASARFELQAVDPLPIDLTARRVAASDDSDPKRRSEEAGSPSREAVTKWPARR
jgi:uncharacterized protein YegP (UPF0339 family)